MPPVDQAFYEGVVRRIKAIILVLGIAGAIFLTVWKGLSVGGGFLIGAAAAYVSFWRWQRVVESIGTVPVRRPWLFALRFVVLLAVAYVIIRVTGVDRAAAVAGLLVPGAAVTVEILYELIPWNMNRNSG